MNLLVDRSLLCSIHHEQEGIDQGKLGTILKNGYCWTKIGQLTHPNALSKAEKMNCNFYETEDQRRVVKLLQCPFYYFPQLRQVPNFYWDHRL